jgi:hypothetical protein
MTEITKILSDAEDTVAIAASVLEDLITKHQSSQNLEEMCRLYYLASEAYDELDKQRKLLYGKLEHMSRTVIPEMLDAKKVKNITLDDIKMRFSKNVRISASITDKAAAYQWLRENGHGDLVTETVNSSSLSSFAKEYVVEQQRDLPDDAFKISTLIYTSATKAG